MSTTVIYDNGTLIKGNGNIQVYCLNEDLLRHDLNSLTIKGSLNTLIDIDPNCQDPQLFIKAEANIFSLLEIKNVNGRLDIGFKDGTNFSSTQNIECILQAPSLKVINLVGSGEIAGNYYGANLVTAVTGSGTIELYGMVEKLDSSIQGSGKQNLKNLISQHAKANVMGSGKLSTFAIQSIEAEVMGSGTIDLSGTKLKINKSVLGSGKINDHKNHSIKKSPFIFKDIFKKLYDLSDYNSNDSSNNTNSINKIIKDKNTISVTQISKGNNTLIIGGNTEPNSHTDKKLKPESFLNTLKKFF